jgi:hypothetical protein
MTDDLQVAAKANLSVDSKDKRTVALKASWMDAIMAERMALRGVATSAF